MNTEGLQQHQIRVLDELRRVSDDRSKLQAFLGTETFNGLPVLERVLLRQQLVHMTAYEQTLKCRVDMWREAS